jgi:hypothetical protein
MLLLAQWLNKDFSCFLDHGLRLVEEAAELFKLEGLGDGARDLVVEWVSVTGGGKLGGGGLMPAYGPRLFPLGVLRAACSVHCFLLQQSRRPLIVLLCAVAVKHSVVKRGVEVFIYFHRIL